VGVIWLKLESSIFVAIPLDGGLATTELDLDGKDTFFSLSRHIRNFAIFVSLIHINKKGEQ